MTTEPTRYQPGGIVPPPRPHTTPLPPPRPVRGESLTSEQHRRHIALSQAVRVVEPLHHPRDADLVVRVAERFLTSIETGTTQDGS